MRCVLNQWLSDELEQRRSQGLLRTILVARHLGDATIEIDNQRLVNFGANDYLGLATHPDLISAAMAVHDPDEMSIADKLRRWGSSASPLITGYGPGHAALEHALAEYEQAEAAIVFSTGYAANAGTVAALVGSRDIIFSDAWNHASLIDGCRLSRAKICVYPHANVEMLRAIVSQYRGSAQRAFVVTDSLFSMDGDIAPLKAIVEIAEEFDMVIIVDEAHATGVYGQHGLGVCESLGLVDRIPVRIGTLSKAIGSLGGFVVGSQALIDYLRNFARTYIYSTAMPTAMTHAARAGLKLAHQMSNEREQLKRTSIHLRKMLHRRGYSVGPGDSPIIPVYFDDAETVVHRAFELRHRGHFVPAVRPPTVPRDRSLLRISLSIQHTDQQIASLIQSFPVET